MKRKQGDGRPLFSYCQILIIIEQQQLIAYLVTNFKKLDVSLTVKNTQTSETLNVKKT